MTKHECHRQVGAGLVESLVGVALLGLGMGVFFKVSQDSYKSISHSKDKGDRSLIKQAVITYVDCDDTFEEAKITDDNIKNLCTSSFANQKPPFLRLRRLSKGDPLYLGSPLIKKGPLRGSSRIGNWYVRTTCSSSENSLVIKLAKASATGGFAKDLRGRTLDFNHPDSLIVSGQGSYMPLCLTKGSGSVGKFERIEARVTGYRSAPTLTPIPPAVADDFIVTPSAGNRFSPIKIGLIYSWSSSNSSGVRCNEAKGWKTFGCYSSTRKIENDILFDPNYGCATNDFKYYSAAAAMFAPNAHADHVEWRVICAR